MRWDDEPLFEMPRDAPVKRAKTLRDLEKAARPTITRYRTRERVPCDECMLLLFESGGVGAYSRSARWRLSVKGTILLLCNEHADAWRAGVVKK